MDTNINGVIIREIYDNEHAEEYFEQQLERALDVGYETIIIEPNRLAEETAHWIKVGNCLHDCAVVFGLSSICLSIMWNRNSQAFALSVPFTTVSVFCAGLYMISWQLDPCCKYQIASDTDKAKLKERAFENRSSDFSEFVIFTSRSTSPTILIRKDDTTRKIIHSAIALFAFTFTVIRFYK